MVGEDTCSHTLWNHIKHVGCGLPPLSPLGPPLLLGSPMKSALSRIYVSTSSGSQDAIGHASGKLRAHALPAWSKWPSDNVPGLSSSEGDDESRVRCARYHGPGASWSRRGPEAAGRTARRRFLKAHVCGGREGLASRSGIVLEIFTERAMYLDTVHT